MKKDIIYKLRMSETEQKIFRKKAELLNTTVADLLRQSALNRRVDGFKMSDIGKEEEQCKGQMNLLDMEFNIDEIGISDDDPFGILKESEALEEVEI